MATTQPITNFVFELEQIKEQVNKFAQRVGIDMKSLQDNTQLGSYRLTGLNVKLTGSIVASDTILAAFGKLQNQINNVSVPTFKYNLTASSDLNSITTSGLHSAAAGIPKLVKNYPTTEAGTLTQNVIGTLKTQQYISITGLMFVRGYNGTAWSTWRSI